jgi:hypothetical protein
MLDFAIVTYYFYSLREADSSVYGGREIKKGVANAMSKVRWAHGRASFF